MSDRQDADHAWMTIVDHFVARAHSAEDGISTTLDHLGEVLYFLADLHPDDRCMALDDALAFYNAQRPEKKVVPTGAADVRILIKLPGESHQDQQFK